MSNSISKVDNNDKTVYVIDSYGLIFRCYFAFISRPLTNKNGENVSAVFGFFRNLHWVLEHYKPGCILAAMDSKTKTFRHEMYAEYKATRNKTPDDLHAQVPWICDILETLGIPVLQCDGYEADDIIATVAKKCAEQGRGCRILSGDKDLMQLVGGDTEILKPESGASTWKVTNADAVEAEWGVRPEKLLDLLSLYGDTADNIPGVHGVGVKTAAKLLTDYGDLDGIYAHIDEIKGAMQKKLADGKDSAYFSKKLITLFDEVPCPDIDTAINSPRLTFDYKAAADKMFSYGVPSVAKAYAEMDFSAQSKAQKENSQNNKNDDDKSKSDANSISTQEIDFSESTYIQPVQNDTSSYKAITSVSDLEAYVTGCIKKAESSENLPLAYDSETTSLDTMTCKILGFSLCYEKGKAVYIPLQQESSDLFSETNYITTSEAFTQLARLFSNSKLTIVMHNAKFDLKVLASNGFFAETKLKLSALKLADTMIISWLINPEHLGKNGYSLEYLSETIVGLKGIEFSDIVPKGQTFADVPLDTAYKYAAEDADFTLQLYNKLEEKIKSTQTEAFTKLLELEMKVLPILTQMELYGIHLEPSKLNDYNEELTRNIALIEQNIYKEVGHQFNIASPKQLQTVLFEERGLKSGKKTKTGYSTDTSVLEELSEVDEVPRMILEYRELAKLKSTYVETLPKLADESGRIHTDFVQTGTATGRLSCREPNLQNIPVRNEAGRRIRAAFTAPKGKVLISADYAQIELVVLAHLSGDENMRQSFINGTDVHKATAALIYGVEPEQVLPEMRRTAKTINFGVIYGMSAFRLAKDLGISRTQAASFIDSYFMQYSKIKDFINGTVASAEEKSYVETLFGRRRPVMNINSKNKVEKSAAERVTVNTPVQGTAADIVKKAMVGVTYALKEADSPAKLLLQVHDELIFECPDDKAAIENAIAIIKDKMENAVQLSVPLRVSIEYGKSWGEFH